MAGPPPGAGGPPPPRPCEDLSSIDPAFATESRMPAILGPLTAIHFLAVAVVCLRLYTRIVLIKSPGRDDWVMLAAILCTIGGWILWVCMVSMSGMGKHWASLTCEQQDMHSELSFYMSIISTTGGIALLKISICLNLLRLSTSRWYSISLWCTLGLVCAYQFMGAMTWFFRCIPLKKTWNPSIEGSCYGIDLFITFALVNTAFNIFTDVLCASLPVPIIWQLQMKRRTRFYLIGVLSLGYAAVVLGILKAIWQMAYAGPKNDKTFEPYVTFWGFLQLNVGIIAACAPSLKPLVSRALGLTSKGDSNHYSPSGYGGSRGTGALRTIGGGNGASALRSKPRDHFELHDMDDDKQNVSQYSRGTNDASATFYKANSDGERSGSEERILGARQDFKGIVRTTEVIVT